MTDNCDNGNTLLKALKFIFNNKKDRHFLGKALAIALAVGMVLVAWYFAAAVGEFAYEWLKAHWITASCKEI